MELYNNHWMDMQGILKPFNESLNKNEDFLSYWVLIWLHISARNNYA